MIYVLCPDHIQPSGGVRKLYLHVDILNEHGIPAALVHIHEGFRCNWFAHSTPILYAARVDPDPANDFVVVPEMMGPELAKIGVGTPKVILNQNAYLTFYSYRIQPKVETPYTHPEVVGAFCVSEDNYRYLSYVFPNLFIQRLHYGIDPGLFHPEPKIARIAVMPRKQREQAVQILSILILRDALRDVQVKLIQNMSEQETAEVLRQSMIFLSLSDQEGFGLPPAEAMACGCIVVGYHGVGGREFFKPEHCFPVEADDIITYVQTIERVLDRIRAGDAEIAGIGERAARFIAQEYSLERERADVINAWKSIHARLGRTFPSPSAT